MDMPNANVFYELARLESALLNLVLNSRDAILRSGEGNRIELRARGVGGLEDQENTADVDGKSLRYIEVSVPDNGPGMSEEVLAWAIDPFFTTKDTNSGTGLGLSMVYGFARQADGDLRIYSEEGLGTANSHCPVATIRGCAKHLLRWTRLLWAMARPFFWPRMRLSCSKQPRAFLKSSGTKFSPHSTEAML